MSSSRLAPSGWVSAELLLRLNMHIEVQIHVLQSTIESLRDYYSRVKKICCPHLMIQSCSLAQALLSANFTCDLTWWAACCTGRWSYWTKIIPESTWKIWGQNSPWIFACKPYRSPMRWFLPCHGYPRAPAFNLWPSSPHTGVGLNSDYESLTLLGQASKLQSVLHALQLHNDEVRMHCCTHSLGSLASFPALFPFLQLNK